MHIVVPCESQSVMFVESCAVKVAMDGAVVAAVAVVPAGKTSLWTRVTIGMSIEVSVVLDLSVGVLTRLSIDAAINALTDDHDAELNCLFCVEHKRVSGVLLLCAGSSV